MRSSKSSPAGNSSMCTSSVANSWILASAAFRPVLRSTNTYLPWENVPNRVLGAGVPQMVHLGARTGFVQELQMSHRQTWLILRDMAVGAALGITPGVGVRAFRLVTRLWRALRPTLYKRVASWLRARRGAARTGLPLCCHSALQARDRTSSEAVPGATRAGDPPYDSVAHNHENPFCKPKKLRAGSAFRPTSK